MLCWRDMQHPADHRGFIGAVIVAGMVNQHDQQDEAARESRKPWTLREFGGKPLWDWMQLLIVPLVLAIIGLLFQLQQAERQRTFDKQQQTLEDRRAEAEQEVAEQRAQAAALQAYLDQMGDLLLEKNLRESDADSEVRTLARARTLVVLETLDSDRNNRVLRFLEETGLIQSGPEGRAPIVSLKYAALGDFKLKGRQLLRGTDLTQAGLNGANLSAAHLEGTDLSGAHLGESHLRDAYLRDAKLSGADLRGADLRGADLRGADLSDAEGRFESGAHMVGTRLDGAYLDGADLTNARVSEEQLLREPESLEGATMPNGKKYEEWLKDEEDREKEGNHGGS